MHTPAASKVPITSTSTSAWRAPRLATACLIVAGCLQAREQPLDDAATRDGAQDHPSVRDGSFDGAGGRGTGGTTTGAGGSTSGAGGMTSGAGGMTSGAGGMTTGVAGRGTGGMAGAGGMTTGVAGRGTGAGGMTTGVGGMTTGVAGRGTGGGGAGGSSMSCPANQRVCNGVCVASNSPTACGAGCTVCPAPASHGTATCDGTSCGIMCEASYRSCAGTTTCIPTAAGYCCSNGDCTAGGTGMLGTCTSNTCAYACDTPTYKMCGTACIRAARPSCCTNTDCDATAPVCQNNTCTKRALGQTCAAASECASNNCVDGVCCNATSCGTCRRCNLNGQGTCSAAPQGTADSACAASTADCRAGGCDGSGGCRPAAPNTVCGSSCANSNPFLGQFGNTALREKVCNGTAATSAACVDCSGTGTACPDQLVCANATSCRTVCTRHADCAGSNYCDNGTCVYKKPQDSSCASGFECASNVCAQTLGPATTCVPCKPGTSYACPIAASACYGNTIPLRCTDCEGAGCATDGSTDCSVAACPANAPNCDATNHCYCGATEKCFVGEVCVSGQCRTAPGWPCQASGECGYGSCTNGACTPGASGNLCPGLNSGECASGLTCRTPTGAGTTRCM